MSRDNGSTSPPRPALGTHTGPAQEGTFHPKPGSSAEAKSGVTAVQSSQWYSSCLLPQLKYTTSNSNGLAFSNISNIINSGLDRTRLQNSRVPSISGEETAKCIHDNSVSSGADPIVIQGEQEGGCVPYFNREKSDQDGEGIAIPPFATNPPGDVVRPNSPALAPLRLSPGAAPSLSTLTLTPNLPPAPGLVVYGFGGTKMVSGASSQTLIYRSIPPRPLSYNFTDVLESSRLGGKKHRSKTAPVSTNAPEEYVQRFKSRPTTRPKVIEFDGSVVSRPLKSAVSSGFPTARARIYIGHPRARPVSEASESHQLTTPPSRAGSKLQLQPLTHLPQNAFSSGRASSHAPQPQDSAPSRSQRSDRPPRTPVSGGHDRPAKPPGSTGQSAAQLHHQRTLAKSAASSVPGQPAKSTVSTSNKPTDNLKETSQSVDFNPAIPADLPADDDMIDHIHNPDVLLTSSTDCDDLSILPRPKKVLPKRELPWVFRYKVKRGMNTLTRIMASKPPQGFMHSSHTFT